MEGTVKWFDEKKGYGFITAEEKDYFVFYTSIQAEGFKTLKEGQNVSFDIVDGKKGKEAANVVVK